MNVSGRLKLVSALIALYLLYELAFFLTFGFGFYFLPPPYRQGLVVYYMSLVAKILSGIFGGAVTLALIYLLEISEGSATLPKKDTDLVSRIFGLSSFLYFFYALYTFVVFFDNYSITGLQVPVLYLLQVLPLIPFLVGITMYSERGLRSHQLYFTVAFFIAVISTFVYLIMEFLAVYMPEASSGSLPYYFPVSVGLSSGQGTAHSISSLFVFSSAYPVLFILGLALARRAIMQGSLLRDGRFEDDTMIIFEK